MVDLLSGTHQFMRVGGQLAPEKSGPNTDQQLRIDLLTEEMQEYLDGVSYNDLVEEVDGLVDIMVVAAGSLISRVGLPCARQLVAEVVDSNLSKFIVNDQGNLEAILREDGKILKGPNYWEPRIAEVLEKNGVER